MQSTACKAQHAAYVGGLPRRDSIEMMAPYVIAGTVLEAQAVSANMSRDVQPRDRLSLPIAVEFSVCSMSGKALCCV